MDTPNLKPHPYAIMPPLPKDEYDALKEDIRLHRQKEPIWVYQNAILDGVQRYRACVELGRKPWIKYWTSKGNPLDFVVSRNLRRRHLDTTARALIGVHLLELYEKEAEENKSSLASENAKGRKRSKEGKFTARKGAKLHPTGKRPKSNDRAANAVGLSSRTISGVKKMKVEHPEVFEKLGSTLTFQNAKVIASLPREKQQSVLGKIDSGIKFKDAVNETRKEEWLKDTAKFNALPMTNRYRVEQGDFADKLKSIEDGSIDAIITDPPYAEGFLESFDGLCREASRVLKPCGVMLVEVGKYYLPEVMSTLGKYLRYHWTFCVVFNDKSKVDLLTADGTSLDRKNIIYLNPRSLMHQIGVKDGWRPVLCYVKGDYINKNGVYPADVIVGDGKDKSYHEHGQPVAEMESLVKIFTGINDKVLDPCAGGGSAIIAALKNDRYAIGIDRDEASVAGIIAKINHLFCGEKPVEEAVKETPPDHIGETVEAKPGMKRGRKAKIAQQTVHAGVQAEAVSNSGSGGL